jgi:uncharacterized membrane protein
MRRAVPYAAQVPILKTLHVFGAIFLLGGVSTHALLRPMAARAADVVQHALYQFAWRVEVALVYTGSALVLVTGVLLWVIGHFKFGTGWLLLGVLLYVAAAGLDGAFLAPNLRRAKTAAGEGSQPVAAAAVTVQLVAWLLLVVIVFLMVAQPF